MKRVHPSEIAAVDLGTLINEQDEARRARPDARSEVYVYVLDVTFHGEYGWTSVHRTADGARTRLAQKVDEYGVRAAYEAQLKDEISGDTSTAAGFEGDVVVYGISYLPVEE